MKILKPYIIILLLTLFSISAFAQSTGIFWRGLDESSNRLHGKLTGETYYISSLANSNFFLHKEMLEGKIELTNGDIFNDIKVRFLVYGNELIAYNENLRTLFTVDKEIIKEFTIYSENKAERKFIKLYFNGLFEGERYFEELYTSSRSLLLFHHVNEVKVSPFTDKSGVMRDTEYRLQTTYYLHSEENNFTKLRTRRRSFYKALPERKKEIRKLFRKRKLNVFDERSMVQAISAIDEAGLLK